MSTEEAQGPARPKDWLATSTKSWDGTVWHSQSQCDPNPGVLRPR